MMVKLTQLYDGKTSEDYSVYTMSLHPVLTLALALLEPSKLLYMHIFKINVALISRFI